MSSFNCQVTIFPMKEVPQKLITNIRCDIDITTNSSDRDVYKNQLRHIDLGSSEAYFIAVHLQESFGLRYLGGCVFSLYGLGEIEFVTKCEPTMDFMSRSVYGHNSSIDIESLIMQKIIEFLSR